MVFLISFHRVLFIILQDRMGRLRLVRSFSTKLTLSSDGSESASSNTLFALVDILSELPL